MQSQDPKPVPLPSLEEIKSSQLLQKDCEILPKNYNFEIAKTVWKIKSVQAKNVALQFPEGLLLYACVISDILEKHGQCNTVIMGDVTYGACCVDDITARALGCDLLVHYGHSCLVPIQDTPGIHMLYVFVEIQLNVTHFVETLRHNFEKGVKIALISTIQFVKALQDAKLALNAEGYEFVIPQCKPLSPGEVLGCTSPKLPQDAKFLVYLGDGRFHLESAMIANPSVPTFQYDPYSRKFTQEYYEFCAMNQHRHRAIEKAKDAKCFGLILGTLGRQGNTKILKTLEEKLDVAGKSYIRVLMSEVFPQKLQMFTDVDCWVQVACPRLSIDWGESFAAPLLTPYELAVVLSLTQYSTDSYPMDFYANDSLGPWTNKNEAHRPKRVRPQVTRPHVPIVVQSK